MYPGYYGYAPYYGAAPDQLTSLRGAQMPSQAQGPQPMQQPSMAANAQHAQNGAPIWVQGEAGAKSYMVAPGNTVMLMDSEDQVFYIKSADQSGMPLPLRIFDYRERVAAPSQTAQNAPQAASTLDPSNYITRQEFEQWKASLTVTPSPAAAESIKEDSTNG